MDAIKKDGDAAYECLLQMLACVPDEYHLRMHRDSKTQQECYEQAINSAACRQVLREIEQGKAKTPAPKSDD